MERNRKTKAFAALRFFLLAIAALLTAVPVTTAHAIPLNHVNQITATHDAIASSKTDHEAGIEQDCAKHAPAGKVGRDNESGSCCQVFCAAIGSNSDHLLETPGVVRQSFVIAGSSAVLPGEYPAPHRPPNT